MDIRIINATIEQLQEAETTPENVDELSKLYIVRNNLNQSQKYSNNTNTKLKLLPCYENYIDIKRQYQMHQTSEDAVEVAIKEVCAEINELISTLYFNSDLRKERKYLRECINNLSTICEK